MVVEGHGGNPAEMALTHLVLRFKAVDYKDHRVPVVWKPKPMWNMPARTARFFQNWPTGVTGIELRFACYVLYPLDFPKRFHMCTEGTARHDNIFWNGKHLEGVPRTQCCVCIDSAFAVRWRKPCCWCSLVPSPSRCRSGEWMGGLVIDRSHGEVTAIDEVKKDNKELRRKWYHAVPCESCLARLLVFKVINCVFMFVT